MKLKTKSPTAKTSLIAYVDGSYNTKNQEYGYGCVIIENNRIIKELYGKGSTEEYASMRNVSGEILGCLAAVSYGITHDYSEIEIRYDYKGIEMWATNQWKAKARLTKLYKETIQDMQNYIVVTFTKVAAHTGEEFNELADALAKKSLGISK